MRPQAAGAGVVLALCFVLAGYAPAPSAAPVTSAESPFYVWGCTVRPPGVRQWDVTEYSNGDRLAVRMRRFPPNEIFPIKSLVGRTITIPVSWKRGKGSPLHGREP